jgi:hypothetical protein
LRRSHNNIKLPFPEGVVNSGMILCQQVSL